MTEQKSEELGQYFVARQNENGSGLRFGGFWIRVIAYIIDSIVLWVPLSAISYFFIHHLTSAAISDSAFSLHLGKDGSLDVGTSLASSSPSLWLNSMYIFYIAPLILDWLYHAFMESSSWSATLGKKAFGLKVLGTDGYRIRFLQATGRHFSKYVSAGLICIGFLMVAFQREKRGLHDFMAGTVVAKIT